MKIKLGGTYQTADGRKAYPSYPGYKGFWNVSIDGDGGLHSYLDDGTPSSPNAPKLYERGPVIEEVVTRVVPGIYDGVRITKTEIEGTVAVRFNTSFGRASMDEDGLRRAAAVLLKVADALARRA